MIKILFVLPSITQANGVTAFLTNYLKRINLKEFKIAVLASDLRPSENYIKLFESLNIDLHLLPNIPQNGLFKYLKALKKFFKNNHDYDMVYSNVANQSYFIFKQAKKYGIKKRVVHSHATKSSDSFISRVRNYFLIKWMLKLSTHRVACSEAAGTAMFGDRPFTVVNNAVDYDKYAFNPSVRKELRGQLNIDNSTKVVGFVGRFVQQKNVFFFIDLAENLANEDVKILMLGTGVLKNEFVEKVRSKGLVEKFTFIGECENAHEYYSAMDCFLLPSIFEGLPVVAVEAQANGLKCLLSDKITKETKISEDTEFLDISNCKNWANAVMLSDGQRKEVILNEKFDISVQAQKFAEFLKAL